MIRTAAVVSMLVAGPTFAGDSVVWGENARSGALRVMHEPLRERCAESLAVDGDRIVVGSACGIAIHSPAGVTKMDVGDVHDVALAGPYLAWTGDDVAVQPDGIVAFTYGGQEGHQVAWAAPGTPGVVGLDAAPRVDDLRIAGGRVLYERRRGVTERRRRRGDLDFEPGRAAWAVNNRIVVRDL